MNPVVNTRECRDRSLSGEDYKVVIPTRVNLLGEHADYTGGLVLPMAISFHILTSAWE